MPRTTHDGSELQNCSWELAAGIGCLKWVRYDEFEYTEIDQS